MPEPGIEHASSSPKYCTTVLCVCGVCVSLLMSAVSGEDMQDRTDRAILTPWLKFLWESYRQCLDLLRNNVTVEKLYHEVAQNGI